jgi:tetratricopeptide (TPR) repeat protein
MKAIYSPILLFFCLSLSTIILSQTPKIDSLKIELQNHNEKDSMRVNLLNELAFSHFSRDMPKTLEYLDEANALAEVTHFKKGKARNIYIRGITEAIQSNFDQALLYYNEALQLYENIDLKKGIASCYNAMGITYKNKGEYRTSISYFNKSIKIEEEIGSNNLSASLINLGNTYSNLGEFDKAIPPLNKALSIAKANKNEQRIAYSLNNLGTIYLDQGNYPLAQEHFKESLYIDEKLGDSLGIANHLINIGWIYKTQKRYDKAMKSYEKALEIDRRIDNKSGVSSNLNDIGTIHEEIGDYKQALSHYIEALRINKQIGSKNGIPNNLTNIGEVYLSIKDYRTANQYFLEAKKASIEIGNKRVLCEVYIGLSRTYASQKAYKSALSNALKAKEISEKSGFLNSQKDAAGILSKIYEATGNYNKAFLSQQQLKILNDSLFNKENIQKITQLEYEYKYKRALDSANIRELKLTKTVKSTSDDLERSQRNLLLGVIGFLTMILILGAIIFFLKLRHEKSKTHNIAIEQKLLRSQMTPHFIFNSLSVLQGMILNNEDKKSISYLSKFSKLLRITLENSRDKMVPLQQELTAVSNYLELQNLEVSQSFLYTILVDETIDETLFEIPPMLIQPFIENAIEHGFKSIKENRKINVRLMYANKELICTIADNGIGIDAQKENKKVNKKSLATTITSERLKILSKDYKIEGSIRIEDRQKYNEQGTLVTIVIPYKIHVA